MRRLLPPFRDALSSRMFTSRVSELISFMVGRNILSYRAWKMFIAVLITWCARQVGERAAKGLLMGGERILGNPHVYVHTPTTLLLESRRLYLDRYDTLIAR